MAVGTTDPETNGLRRRHVQNENDQPQQEAPERQPRRAPRAQKGFVELLMSPLSFVLGDGEPEDPQASARNFAHSLRRRYGERVTPRFEHTSFRDAVSTARTASKFLLVFLHSNIHDDADAFCRYEHKSREMCRPLESTVDSDWLGMLTLMLQQGHVHRAHERLPEQQRLYRVVGGLCAACGGLWSESVAGMRHVPVPGAAVLRVSWSQRRREDHRWGSSCRWEVSKRQ
jgi:hypothetical protein